VNLLLQFLLGAALIGAMIVLRVFSGRSALRSRLNGNAEVDGCDESECGFGCGGATAAQAPRRKRKI
jgi:hypothetical protein